MKNNIENDCFPAPKIYIVDFNPLDRANPIVYMKSGGIVINYWI